MSRRLLIVAYFYPPLAGGGVHRVLSWTRHLPAHGWTCTVVCAGAEDYWVRDEGLLAQVPAGTEVLRVDGGTPLSAWLRLRRARPAADRARRPGGAFALARRLADWMLVPDPYIGWAQRAVRVARARIAAGGIDALLTSSPPDSAHVAGLSLRRVSSLPWVADFRDPWIGLHFLRPPTPWHAARQRALELAVVRGADLVLAASRTHAEALGGLRPHSLEWLPNGFEPAPPANSVEPDPRFTLVFTGTLYRMPQTEVFLDGLSRWLQSEPAAAGRVRVVLAGPHEAGTPARAHTLGLDAVVRFAGPRSHAESRALQMRADLLLLWKPDGAGYRTMVPGKTYEYLATGRPLLALLPEGDEVSRLLAGVDADRLDPGDAAGVALVLARRYAAWTRSGTTPADPPGWLDAHTREALAGRLAGMLDTVVTGHGGP